MAARLWMTGPDLWITTLRGCAVAGGKLAHARRLRFDLVFALDAASGQDTRPGSAQATRTATVVDDTRPAPSTRTSGSAHPHRSSTGRAASISSVIVDPFIATSAPSGSTSGIDQPSN